MVFQYNTVLGLSHIQQEKITLTPAPRHTRNGFQVRISSQRKRQNTDVLRRQQSRDWQVRVGSSRLRKYNVKVTELISWAALKLKTFCQQRQSRVKKQATA